MRGKKLLLAVLAALALVGCGGGGGEEPRAAPSFAQLPQQVPAQPRSVAADATPVQLYLAFHGVAPGNPTYAADLVTMQASGPQAVASRLATQFSSTSHAALATTVLTNMGVTAATTNSAAYAVLSQALAQIFAVYPSQRGMVVLNLVNLLEDLEDNATYGAAARTFNSNALAAYTYATNANNVTAAGPTLSGVAAKGPLKNAAVDVYDLNSDGSKGALLANGSTADDGSGRFSVMLPSRPAGGVLIEVTGGTYTSAYDGTTVASQKISAMLGSVSAAGESGLSVNPLTDMSIGVTRTYISQRYSLAASLSAADKWVSWAFGLKTAPSRIVPKFDVTQAATDPEAVHLALVLAALDTLGKRLSATDPDAIFASLSADFSDGFFDGRNASQQVTLNGSAMAAATGTTEFLKAFAVTLTGTAAGWRPTYLDAHFSAGTVIERYEARIIPVYVASELAAYFPPEFTTPLPETTSLDTSATGYSCPAEAPISFSSSGVATCGSYNTCSSGTLVMSGTRLSCSDGGMVIYHSSTIAPYTAPTLVPYSASTMNSYLAATTIGEPSSGTIPVFRATAAHIFTQAEREAMMANDRAAGDAAAAKVSGLGVPNDLQMEWLKKIGDAMVASVGR